MEEFELKDARKTHYNERHAQPAGSAKKELKYIDEDTNIRIKKRLDQFTKSLKAEAKGKQDQKLEDWISSNEEAFMVGRNPKKAKPRLELGHWYILFAELFPEAQIPGHPCESIFFFFFLFWFLGRDM